jgi:hypothetical protein
MGLAAKFAEKPLEMICAAVMIVAGIAMAAVLSSWQAVGGALAAFGGALLSWSTASVNTPEQARQILKADLENLSRRLATAAGQISQAVQSVRSEQYDADVGFALISQATAVLYGLVNDIQVMAGSQFSAENLIITVDRCEEMADNLQERLSLLTPEIGNSNERAEGSLNEIRDELDSMRMQLQSARREIQNPKRQSVVENIECPDCGTLIPHKLGLVAGDSAAPHCFNCGARFHAHRRSDGTFFTKTMG